MTAKLELRAVEKSYGAVRAVRRLDLRLERGEFVSLLGPSGCGKSTTLAMIAGFEAPDAGSILVDGRVVNGMAPRDRRIGLVFQDYAVFGKLTVRSNLAFGLEARGVERAERTRRVGAMAERLQLGDLLDRRGESLNMSEMQRVALARVLVTEPELVLLDEPMSNLDADLRARLRSELKQIQRDTGQTVLYVTHDQIEAMSMSDRIAVMSVGDLQQLGTPDAIYEAPVNRFVAEFIGDPPINILPCAFERIGEATGIRITGASAAIPLAMGAMPDGEHLVAVRPHDVRLGGAGIPGIEATVRLVENLGAEHVLHAGVGDELVRVVAPPGAASEGDAVRLVIDAGRCLLIRAGDGTVVHAGGRGGPT